MKLDELPLFTYEIEEEDIYLNLMYISKKERIKIKELSKNCGICLKEFNGKEYAYFFIINDYICINCLNNCSLQSNLKYEQILDGLFQKSLKLENEFKISTTIEKKFFSVFSFFFSLFKILKSKGLYDKNLNINLNLFISVNWDKISFTFDNYKIILDKGKPIILFSEFYNTDFVNYYGSFHFLNNIDILEIYKIHNISFQEINIKFILMNIRLQFNKNHLQILLENEKKYYELKLNSTKTNYDLNLHIFENLIHRYYNGLEFIPAQYLLKRKLVKFTLNSLFSVYYNLLKDEPESNYCTIYYFYERILKILNVLENSYLKEKLNQVQYQLKTILLNKNLIEKKRSESNDDGLTINNKIEFTDDEINELIKVGSQIEKERKEKCYYYQSNEKYILLKFTISYLNFIRDKSNLFIHILLEKYSKNFYFKEIKNTNDIKNFITSIFNKDIIPPKIQIKELIHYLFFEESYKIRIDKIVDNIQTLLLNEVNKNNYYDKKLFKKKNEIQNIGKKEIKYYETILKNLKQPELQKKENRKEAIYNKLILLIIEQISEEYNELKKKINEFETIKNEIIMNINQIIMNTQLNELIIEINKEIRSGEYNNFSLENLFKLWKENEKKKIFKNLQGLILENVNEKLNNLNLEDIKNFLIQFYQDNPNIQINFYEEEDDLNLNLFLYKNGIEPRISKINYNYN